MKCPVVYNSLHISDKGIVKFYCACSANIVELNFKDPIDIVNLLNSSLCEEYRSDMHKCNTKCLYYNRAISNTDMRLKYLDILFPNKLCNIDCKFCFTKNIKNPPENDMKTRYLLSLITYELLNSLDTLSIGSLGELTLDRLLWDNITFKLYNFNKRILRFSTNALWWTPERFDKYEKFIKDIKLSVHYASEKICKDVTGRDHIYDTIHDNIIHMSKCKEVTINVGYIVCSENFMDMSNFIDKYQDKFSSIRFIINEREKDSSILKDAIENIRISNKNNKKVLV